MITKIALKDALTTDCATPSGTSFISGSKPTYTATAIIAIATSVLYPFFWVSLIDDIL